MIFIKTEKFKRTRYNHAPAVCFDPASSFDTSIQTIPHLAFEVNDLDYELANRNLKIIVAPNPPADGIRVAMIEHNGAPIELIEFEKNSKRYS